MSKVTDRKIKSMRNRSVWPSILFFITSLVISAVLVAVIVSAIGTYIIESGFVNSRNNAVMLRDGIEEKVLAGESYEDIFASMQKEINRPIAVNIIDKDDNSVAFYGELLDQESATVFDEDMDISIRLFSDDDDMKADKTTKEISISLTQLKKNIATRFADESATDEQMARSLSKEIYNIEYWISCSIKDRDEKVYVKCQQKIYFNDLVMMIVFSAIAGVIFIILITIYFISAVSSVVRQRYLLKLLLQDPLTGGNNFLAFSSFTTKTLASVFHKKTEYALIDLSLLKYQNYCTLHGTEAGEALLQTIEWSLKKCIHRGESFARVSNADYILLLKCDFDEDEMVSRVNVILEKLSLMMGSYTMKGSPMVDNSHNLKFKAGLYFIAPATTPETKERRSKKNIDVNQLYIKAGIAKQSLADESGLVVYNHEMWEKELWEQKVEATMQEALDKKEFQVYIQPKYHPSTEELVGGEALVRWISPTEGFISPGKFIPIFEKTGFVTKLDDYMISHTAELQANWLNEGKKIVPISVNVSRAHFAQPDLAEHIRDLVDAYPLPHKYIEIELTESAFFDDKKALLTTVKRLQEYGFEVSMDDFGSGYSSLNSLKDLPLNVLKLDAEFFRGDDFDTRGEIVVSEAISLAKQLNMRIVAEGVEKKEQVDFLAEQDCDMIQGYYFAKPMPANEYESRMTLAE